MTQIKPSQIISDQNSRENLDTALPVELIQQGQQTNISTLNTSKPTDIQSQIINSPLSSGENTTPQTPYVKSIKSQLVNFQPDGTTTIDVTLEVTDINNISQYEVRISKKVGSL